MPTILVVDDEPAIAEMLQEISEDEGYDVVTPSITHHSSAAEARAGS